jgi:hypothetical protein
VPAYSPIASAGASGLDTVIELESDREDDFESVADLYPGAGSVGGMSDEPYLDAGWQGGGFLPYPEILGSEEGGQPGFQLHTRFVADQAASVWELARAAAGGPVDPDKALAELEPTVKELHATIEQIHTAADQVTNGDGPVPALLTSSELRSNLESLVANLEQHGILGYKRGKNKEEGKAEQGAKPEEESKGAGRGLFQRKAPATPREGPTGRPFGKN